MALLRGALRIRRFLAQFFIEFVFFYFIENSGPRNAKGLRDAIHDAAIFAEFCLNDCSLEIFYEFRQAFWNSRFTVKALLMFLHHAENVAIRHITQFTYVAWPV